MKAVSKEAVSKGSCSLDMKGKCPARPEITSSPSLLGPLLTLPSLSLWLLQPQASLHFLRYQHTLAVGRSLCLECPISTCVADFLTSFESFLKFYLLNKATLTTLFEITTCPTPHLPYPPHSKSSFSCSNFPFFRTMYHLLTYYINYLFIRSILYYQSPNRKQAS